MMADDDTMFRAGYQFVPTDTELVSHYLIKKQPLPYNGIIECDLYGNKSPWEILDEKKKHYVFTKLRKVSKNRVSRTSGDGTWHGQNAGVEIRDAKKKNLIGIKKTFTFKANLKLKKDFISKTQGNWIMYEFSLDGDSLMAENCSDYVLCRIQKKIKKWGTQEEEEEDHGVANNVADIKNLKTTAETSINEREPSRPNAMASDGDDVLSPNQYNGGLYTTDMTESILLDATQSSNGNSEYSLNFDDLDPVTAEQIRSLYEYLMDDIDELPTLQEDEFSVQELNGFVDCLMENPHQPMQENDVFLLTPMSA